MDEQLRGEDPRELREEADAAQALARDPAVFEEAVEAFRARDAGRFQAALERAGLAERCRLVCRFLCRKHCMALCLRLCPEPPKQIDVAEMRAFAQALEPLSRDPGLLRRLLDVMEAGDPERWRAELEQLRLSPFCHQLCQFLCSWRCELVCRLLCPPAPLITRVGSIPVWRIDPQGLGSGPSIPPFHVPPPNPPGGWGDHPFGASVWLMGIFNMPTATQYRVEIASNPGGPYNPVLVPSVEGYNNNPFPPPFQFPVIRFSSVGADPGWFNVPEIPDSDGGPTPSGEKTLFYWPTGGMADGIYYLRLQVRDGVTTRVSSPQAVQLDNTGPFPLPRPTITLQLQRPDGTRTELKCGKVKKGDGVIVVTVHAHDPHFGAVGVTARGNSGLSIPLISTTAVPLSKTYNGNLLEQGYPVPTEFLWDPWSDPRFVPCCYLVYVEVWDRTILNDHFSGGHYNAGWEAIELGL